MKMFSDAAIAPQEGVRANRASPVIVATDGHDQSNSAMLLGRLLVPESDAPAEDLPFRRERTIESDDNDPLAWLRSSGVEIDEEFLLAHPVIEGPGYV